MKFTDCIEIVGSKPTFYEGTKQYVSTGAVEEYFINKNSIEEYTYNERPSRADLVGKSGDILFAKMAETKKTLILDKETENYLFSTGFFAIRPKSGILTTKCLYYLLNSKNFLSQKDKNSSGATQKAITNAGLEKINVNIPLFSKQDQIVKQFDLLTDIIKKYQSQLKKLDSLIKSEFVEMFGDLDCNIKTIEQTCTMKSGTTFSKDEENDSGEIFYIKVSGMNLPENDKYIKTSLSFVSRKVAGKTIIPANSIIFPKRGGAIGTNKKRITEQEICIDLNTMAVTPSNELNIQYLYQYFQNLDMGKLYNGSTVPQINNKDIGPLKIKVPPLELQQQFAAFVQQIDKSKFEIANSLKRLYNKGMLS